MTCSVCLRTPQDYYPDGKKVKMKTKTLCIRCFDKKLKERKK